MLKTAFIVFGISFLLVEFGCAQQPVTKSPSGPEQPPPAAPMRRVGKAEIRFNDRINRTHVRIYTYVLGESSEVPERKKEVITMEMGFTVNGHQVSQPESLYLRLVSYSPWVPKYQADHGVTINVDGKPLINDPGFNWHADDDPPPTASEAYGIQKLSFSDFRKMGTSKSLSIQLGATKINITGESMDAIRDLLRAADNQ